MLSVVEKVILLQDIEQFKSIPTGDLAYLASIAEEVDYGPDNIIFKEGDYADSMFTVVDGSVRLHRDNLDVMIAEEKDTFGTWALFDNEPRVVTATALEDCLLLRIDKDDFMDLLAENVQITQGILKFFVHRIRGLMGTISGKQ